MTLIGAAAPRPRRAPRPVRTFALAAALSLLAATFPAALRVAAAGPCGPPVFNAVACENTKPGSPSREWAISGYGDASIQGFATDISVNKGSSIGFKVDTDASSYSISVYRLGYYGGAGARLVTNVTPSATQIGRAHV